MESGQVNNDKPKPPSKYANVRARIDTGRGNGHPLKRSSSESLATSSSINPPNSSANNDGRAQGNQGLKRTATVSTMHGVSKAKADRFSAKPAGIPKPAITKKETPRQRVNGGVKTGPKATVAAGKPAPRVDMPKARSAAIATKIRKAPNSGAQKIQPKWQSVVRPLTQHRPTVRGKIAGGGKTVPTPQLSPRGGGGGNVMAISTAATTETLAQSNLYRANTFVATKDQQCAVASLNDPDPGDNAMPITNASVASDIPVPMPNESPQNESNQTVSSIRNNPVAHFIESAPVVTPHQPSNAMQDSNDVIDQDLQSADAKSVATVEDNSDGDADDADTDADDTDVDADDGECQVEAAEEAVEEIKIEEDFELEKSEETPEEESCKLNTESTLDNEQPSTPFVQLGGPHPRHDENESEMPKRPQLTVKQAKPLEMNEQPICDVPIRSQPEQKYIPNTDMKVGRKNQPPIFFEINLKSDDLESDGKKIVKPKKIVAPRKIAEQEQLMPMVMNKAERGAGGDNDARGFKPPIGKHNQEEPKPNSGGCGDGVTQISRQAMKIDKAQPKGVVDRGFSNPFDEVPIKTDLQYLKKVGIKYLDEIDEVPTELSPYIVPKTTVTTGDGIAAKKNPTPRTQTLRQRPPSAKTVAEQAPPIDARIQTTTAAKKSIDWKLIQKQRREAFQDKAHIEKIALPPRTKVNPTKLTNDDHGNRKKSPQRNRDAILNIPKLDKPKDVPRAVQPQAYVKEEKVEEEEKEIEEKKIAAPSERKHLAMNKLPRCPSLPPPATNTLLKGQQTGVQINRNRQNNDITTTTSADVGHATIQLDNKTSLDTIAKDIANSLRDTLKEDVMLCVQRSLSFIYTRQVPDESEQRIATAKAPQPSTTTTATLTSSTAATVDVALDPIPMSVLVDNSASVAVDHKPIEAPNVITARDIAPPVVKRRTVRETSSVRSLVEDAIGAAAAAADATGDGPSKYRAVVSGYDDDDHDERVAIERKKNKVLDSHAIRDILPRRDSNDISASGSDANLGAIRKSPTKTHRVKLNVEKPMGNPKTKSDMTEAPGTRKSVRSKSRDQFDTRTSYQQYEQKPAADINSQYKRRQRGKYTIANSTVTAPTPVPAPIPQLPLFLHRSRSSLGNVWDLRSTSSSCVDDHRPILENAGAGDGAHGKSQSRRTKNHHHHRINKTNKKNDIAKEQCPKSVEEKPKRMPRSLTAHDLTTPAAAVAARRHRDQQRSQEIHSRQQLRKNRSRDGHGWSRDKSEPVAATDRIGHHQHRGKSLDNKNNTTTAAATVVRDNKISQERQPQRRLHKSRTIVDIQSVVRHRYHNRQVVIPSDYQTVKIAKNDSPPPEQRENAIDIEQQKQNARKPYRRLRRRTGAAHQYHRAIAIADSMDSSSDDDDDKNYNTNSANYVLVANESRLGIVLLSTDLKGDVTKLKRSKTIDICVPRKRPNDDSTPEREPKTEPEPEPAMNNDTKSIATSAHLPDVTDSGTSPRVVFGSDTNPDTKSIATSTHFNEMPAKIFEVSDTGTSPRIEMPYEYRKVLGDIYKMQRDVNVNVSLTIRSEGCEIGRGGVKTKIDIDDCDATDEQNRQMHRTTVANTSQFLFSTKPTVPRSNDVCMCRGRVQETATNEIIDETSLSSSSSSSFSLQQQQQQQQKSTPIDDDKESPRNNKRKLETTDEQITGKRFRKVDDNEYLPTTRRKEIVKVIEYNKRKRQEGRRLFHDENRKTAETELDNQDSQGIPAESHENVAIIQAIFDCRNCGYRNCVNDAAAGKHPRNRQ